MKRKTSIVVCLLVAVLSVPALGGRQEHYAYIEGAVTKARTGEPCVSSISLQRVYGDGGGSSRPTQADGSFGEAVLPGVYRITATCDGFAPQSYGQKTEAGPGQAVSLSAGQKLTVRFQMLPAGVVTGRVLDRDGEAVSQARVQAFTRHYREGGYILVSAGYPATTNDLGEYRLFWLNPGDYFIGVDAVPPYPHAFFAATPDPDRASAIHVGPGETVRNIDFVMGQFRPVRVQGRVSMPSSLPEDSLEVSIERTHRPVSLSASEYRQSVRTNRDGTFEISNVVAGSYILTAQSGANLWGRTAVTVNDSDIAGVNISLDTAQDVRGALSLENPPASTFAMNTNFVYLAASGPLAGQGQTKYARVSGDGTFTIANVPRGTYQIKINRSITPNGRVEMSGLPPGSYLATAKRGSDDVTGVVQIGPDPGAPIQLTIGFSPARVTGTIVDASGAPAPDAFVALVSDGSRRGREDSSRSVLADHNGRFTFEGLAPGEYRVLAWPVRPSPAEAFFDPEVVDRLRDHAVPVRLEKSSNVDLKVTLIQE